MAKRIASWIGLALVAVVSASAQIVHSVEVNVPFSFVAAGKTWDAGTYKLDIKPDSGLAALHSSQSGSGTFLIQASQPENIGNKTTVRFERYGNQWVLRAMLGGGIQAEVLPGKLERELMARKASENRTLVARLKQ